MSSNEHMMSVILNTGANPRAFNHFIGKGVRGGYTFDAANDQFEISKGFVSQAQLDQFAIDYAADQANADAAAAAAVDARNVGDLQKIYGDDPILAAVIEVYRQEINVLRSNAGLPDRSAGFIDGQIRAEIATP